MTETKEIPEILDFEDLMTLLGCSEGTIRRLIKK